MSQSTDRRKKKADRRRVAAGIIALVLALALVVPMILSLLL